MHRRKTLTLVAALVVALLGGIYSSRGAVAQSEVCEDREVVDFSAIDVRDTGTLVVTQGDQPSLRVCVREQGIFELVSTRVEDGALELQQDLGQFGEFAALADDWNIRYEVTVPTLSEVNVDGVIEARIENLSVDSLTVNAHGNTDIFLTGFSGTTLSIDAANSSHMNGQGTVDTLNLRTDDASEVRLFDLEAGTANVETYEASIAHVRFVDSMVLETHTLSTVEYMTENGSTDIDRNTLSTVEQVPYVPLPEATPAA